MSAGGLFLARLAEDQQPATGGAGLEAQAPALGEAEFLWIAVHFEKHGGKGAGGEGCLGEPQRILDPARQGMDQPGLWQTEVKKAGGIGETGLAHDMGIGDQKQPLPCLLALLCRHQCEGKAETCHASCLLQPEPSEFDQHSFAEHFTQKAIEEILLPAACFGCAASCLRVRGCRQTRGVVRLSLDPGNCLPQGKKRLTRLRALAHDDLS